MFKKQFEMWMQKQIEQEKNHRRRELLQKGLSHGTEELLRSIWFSIMDTGISIWLSCREVLKEI